MEIKAIKAGRFIDGTGRVPLENITVLIEKNIIKEVGKDIAIPPDAQIIDAQGKTVMPGMIDAHMHLFGSKPDDSAADRLSRPREVGLIKAVFDIQHYLSSGFTMVKDCGGMNGIFLRQSAAEGTLKGAPRIVASGFMLQGTAATPYNFLSADYVDARNSQIAGEAGGQVVFCDGVDECIKATRYVLSRGADFIKLWSRRDGFFNQEEMQAIIQTAAQAGKFVTAHCDNARASDAGIMAGLKTVDHAVGVDQEMAEIGIKKDIIFVSTLMVYKSPIDFGIEAGREQPEIDRGTRQLALSGEAFRTIRKAGGTVAMGTDCGGESLVQKYGTSAVELELLVNYADFSPMDAIVAATKNGAAACFMGDQTGTIEPGKLADIIVVDGDPLADIKILQNPKKIKTVMMEGQVEIDR